MKKNILIGVLALISILSIVFAFIQKTEAEMQRQLADQNAVEAKLQNEVAKMAQHLAEEQRKIAEDCASKK